MINLKKENLEKTIDENPQKPQMSKDEEIGFHKGAIMTLINERNELIKIIGNVDAIMQSHVKRLEELGVKVQRKEQ
jgi:hypothetical protein